MSGKKSKIRIALFGMGIMGGGPLGEGIPVLADLFNRLSRTFDIVYYCFSPIDSAKVPPTIKVRRVVSWRLPGRLKYVLLCARFAIDHLFNRYALIFAVAAYPTGWWAAVLGKIVGRPVLVQFIALEAVALYDIGYGNLTKPWLRKVTENVCKWTTALVTVAEYQKKVAQHSLSTRREIAVLPLRVDTKIFQYRARTVSHPVQFIHIAYYSPIKDQHTLFAAFASVTQVIDCHLTVVGDGFGVPIVQTLLKDLNITDKVTFTGQLPHSELPLYFHPAHILVHTSHFETGCAVIQEAMASGVAVCGTEVGILADIGDRYAAIVPPGDRAKLAEKMLELVNTPGRYREISREAFEWISKYDAAWSAHQYQLFIQEMLIKGGSQS